MEAGKKQQEYLVYYCEAEDGQALHHQRSRFVSNWQQYFLERQLENVDNYITALKTAHAESLRISAQAVLKELPAEICGLLRMNDGSRSIMTEEEVYQQEDREWREKQYVKSDRFPQHLTHRTGTGEMVRSKSEVIIYEMLLKYDIAFRYEWREFIDGYEVHPDFTIRRRDGKLFYWEHCGMMNQQNYVDRYHWKINLFEKNKIVLWDNLILTFDDPYGNIDVNMIESEIRNKLLRW